MAQVKVKFFKVTGLPSEPEANSIYYVIGDSFAEWYVTDADGFAAPSGNTEMINALIEAANLALLDEDGKLNPAVIPVFKSHEFIVVANQAARLLLTEEDVQLGDEAFELDSGKTYTLVATDPTQGASWRFKSDTTPEWTAIANKPSTFAPSAHTHPMSDIVSADNLTIGTIARAQLKINGEDKQVSIGDVNSESNGTRIMVDEGNAEIIIKASSGIAMNLTRFLGLTFSDDTPTTAEFPADKDWGFHSNTASGQLYIAFNNEGVILSRVLA